MQALFRIACPSPTTCSDGLEVFVSHNSAYEIRLHRVITDVLTGVGFLPLVPLGPFLATIEVTLRFFTEVAYIKNKAGCSYYGDGSKGFHRTCPVAACQVSWLVCGGNQTPLLPKDQSL